MFYTPYRSNPDLAYFMLTKIHPELDKVMSQAPTPQVYNNPPANNHYQPPQQYQGQNLPQQQQYGAGQQQQQQYNHAAYR